MMNLFLNGYRRRKTEKIINHKEGVYLYKASLYGSSADKSKDRGYRRIGLEKFSNLLSTISINRECGGNEIRNYQ